MIIVTGMHRSGTSLLAMTLEALDLDFGDHDEFYAADRWNEEGYFERRDVIDMNSRLLSGHARTAGRLGSVLSQVRYLAGQRESTFQKRARDYEADLAPLAASLDGIAVKDPRFCLTYDAWTPHVDVEMVIIALRHPTAVVSSLHRRQHIPRTVAYRFWNRHAEGLLSIDHPRRLFVRFERLVGDRPAAELERVVRFLGLDITVEEALARFQSRFVSSLQHHASVETGLPEETKVLWDAITRVGSP
ncbi:MAG: hypothetical protein HKO03_01320 [Acidimicrobiia bacterium]|nr:hypothetical protein [Acidimicrobiia bacterium]NNF65473.1 hypothetical protein [Acidimicrobiia bacterium]